MCRGKHVLGQLRATGIQGCEVRCVLLVVRTTFQSGERSECLAGATGKRASNQLRSWFVSMAHEQHHQGELGVGARERGEAGCLLPKA